MQDTHARHQAQDMQYHAPEQGVKRFLLDVTM